MSSVAAVTTSVETSNLTAKPVLEIGRAWMASPGTARRGSELGFEPGFDFWVNGRAGALGDVSAQVAAAAIGFMAPDLVVAAWNRRPNSLSAIGAAHGYRDAAIGWGQSALAPMDTQTVERMAGLVQRVLGAALPICGVLFAGWRELPVGSNDPRAQAIIGLQVLREMRGGAHLSAVQAAGLTPHDAIVSFTADQVRGGVSGAERFGWKGPHREPDEKRRSVAEQMTTSICAPAFEALDATERSELIDLITQARELI